MKKLSILALAAILVIFFTVPASALENEFGGYWRTRFFTQKYFSGFDRGDDRGDASIGLLDIDLGDADDDTVDQVDTRTRLYYTAKINDNLKLVNKFEFDAVWGGQDSRNLDNRDDKVSSNPLGLGSDDGDGGIDFRNRKSPTSYGDVGSDGVSIEVKNSYADFNLGPVNFTVGVQPYELFRGFGISDDASGIIGRWKATDNFILAASWLKNFEGGGGSSENEDLDTYTVTGAFWFTENISLKASVSTGYASELDGQLGAELLALGAPNTALAFIDRVDFATGEATGVNDGGDHGEALLVSYGVDFDMAFDKWSLWLTAFGQTGEVEDVLLRDPATNATGDDDFDIEAYLIAVGGDVSFGEVGFLGNLGLHSEFFYATGDDDFDDDDIEGVVAPAASYYWSEIMGFGLFDNQASAGSPADKITNIWAFNLGTTMQPLDKLKIALDLWYAERVEDEQTLSGEDELGTELDMRITYELVEGLNLDLVGAYLWADDATSNGFEENEEDPYEFGAQLSLSF